MIPILASVTLSILASAIGTPWLIGLLLHMGIGQPIREDGPATHLAKRGTPTMGGLVFLIAATLAYLGAHVRMRGFDFRWLTLQPAGLIVVGTMWSLGLLGFLDDYVKVRHRRSLGLNKRAKVAGQVLVGAVLAYVVSEWAAVPRGISWAGFEVPFARSMPALVFAVWVILVVAGTSNAVNLTDGLDGLASGSTMMTLFVFTIIAFWQQRHSAFYLGGTQIGRDAMLDVAMICAALLGACFGFLWFNAKPARIIMGDTGSLGLGGALAAIAIVTRTQLLLMVIGALFVVEAVSVLLQVVAYRVFGRRRVFKMAPLHHHFELTGWAEFTTIVRFWMFAALAAGMGLAIFYQHFLNTGGLD